MAFNLYQDIFQPFQEDKLKMYLIKKTVLLDRFLF